MKKTVVLIMFVVAPFHFLFAQDVKKEAKKLETKMEVFASKTGTITKFIDYNLPKLRLYLGEVAETRIRKLISGNDVNYFYQISKKGEYSNNTASIEYSDLLEVIKALKTLKSEVENDIKSSPDYLENKFITVDGFQLGYYVGEGKNKWYMKLEKYGSESSIFINNVEEIENALETAKNKIDELKK